MNTHSSSLTRRRLIRAAAILLALVFSPLGMADDESALAGHRSAHELEQLGFQPLFDGKTLTGWDIKPCHEGHWVARDGMIDYDGLGEGKRFADNTPWTTDEFGDFEMDVEVRSTREMQQQCTQAPLLRPGTAATGSTSGADEFHASCAGGARSPEALYRLQLRRRQHVRLSLETSFDGALYIRRDCLDESTELACNDDHMDTRHSLIETTLDRGTYYVFVDGYSSGGQGTYTLNVELQNP